MEAAAGEQGIVDTEMGYRPAPEHEYWIADVAFVSRERWDETSDDRYLEAPPELVIEVLSPSNTVAEIREKKKLCLENGSREFWVVDVDYHEVDECTPGRPLHHLPRRPGDPVVLRSRREQSSPEIFS